MTENSSETKNPEREEAETVSSSELLAINERLLIAGIGQMELAEMAQQMQRLKLSEAQEAERVADSVHNVR